MTTTPPNFGDVPWPERDLEAPYDHERAAREFLDAADRIYSQAKVGAIPFDINVITAAQVNATIRRRRSHPGHASGTPLKIKRREERLKIKRWEDRSSLQPRSRFSRK
jgi:hypothetical protein